MTKDKNFVPRLVFWETTAGRNLRCLHCRRLDVVDEVTKDDLTTEQALGLVDQIAAAFKPILVLSGGEPLFRKDIFEIAERAHSRGLMAALATNGTLVDPATAKRIQEAKIARVSVSLDGAKPATHDRFRGEGNFEKALAGIRNLKAVGMSLQINFTVARHNAAELPAIYDLALELGVDALHLFMLVPVGCGEELADTDMLTAEEYERRLQWFHEKDQEGRIQLKATCAPHYFRIVHQKAGREGLPPSFQRQRDLSKAPAGHPAGHPHSLNQATRGCLAGIGVCFVSHKGDVFPCGYLPVKAGNVLERPFSEIWQDSDVFASLRDEEQLKGKCGACAFKRVCGGCRARAYSETKDPLAEEPFCVYEPPAWKKEQGG